MSLFAEKDRERQTLELHAAHTGPELDACETRLRCHIEGIEKDRLLIRFTHIDKMNIDREFSFVLDVASRSNQGVSVNDLSQGCSGTYDATSDNDHTTVAQSPHTTQRTQ
jgi:hypothetical protein